MTEILLKSHQSEVIIHNSKNLEFEGSIQTALNGKHTENDQTAHSASSYESTVCIHLFYGLKVNGCTSTFCPPPPQREATFVTMLAFLVNNTILKRGVLLKELVPKGVTSFL